MLRLAICDDEKYMRNELTRMAQDFLAVNKVETDILQFSGGKELLEYEKRLDIIFLDIQMSGLDGMETAKRLRARNDKGLLIFVTVMEELVFRSFEVQAFDYLVKPIGEERFRQTMQRLLSSVNTGAHASLLVRRGSEWHMIPFDDIVYCEIVNRKIYLHLAGREIVDYYDKIENLEKKLDGRFFRCHRSYLINLKYLKSCRGDTACLGNGEEVPVSRLRREEFSGVILQYMKEWRY